MSTEAMSEWKYVSPTRKSMKSRNHIHATMSNKKNENINSHQKSKLMKFLENTEAQESLNEAETITCSLNK